MRHVLALGSAFAVTVVATVTMTASGCQGSGSSSDGNDAAVPTFGIDGSPESSIKCDNLACQIPTCVDLPAGTTLLGKVFDPSGGRPIYNAVVYVPNAPLAPMATGASCDRCDASHSGAPLRITTTDASGHFELNNVPEGDNIPLVVQLGKWRRTVTIANVPRCADTTINVNLPRNRTEGDIPRIALATGAADALPCLLRKIGIDESEFGLAGSDARIHLYRGGGYDDSGTPRLASAGFAAGTAFPDAESLWNDPKSLAKYDAVFLACEGADNDDAVHKSAAAKQALYDYAKAGGRVLATHHHHTFFSGSPDPAPKGVAQWSDRPGPAAGDPRTSSVDTDVASSFPKATALTFWLTQQKVLTSGKLPVVDARHDVDGVNTGALAWIQAANPSFPTAPAVQHVTFGAPINAPDAQVCGRVAFTNLHVGSLPEGALQDDATKPFPASCQTKTLTAQQKALEFLLFDLVSCAQPDGAKLVVPH